MKKIAVLLTCFNRKDKTRSCLCQLERGEFDIFLVDDGSTDGTTEMIESEFPYVQIIQGDGRLFWNRGMNKAWSVAAKSKFYDYFIWLNDDTYLVKDAILTLIISSEKCGDSAIIVGTTISAKTKLITYGGRNRASDLIVPNGKLQECNHFNGNIVLIPSYVYEILGNLDPIFHHTLGDFDYGMRAETKKIKKFIAPIVLGYCELHDSFPNYFLPSVPLIDRLISIYKSSSGCNPFQQFIFEKRHYGLLVAIFHWCTIHLRVLFPSILNKRKSL